MGGIRNFVIAAGLALGASCLYAQGSAKALFENMDGSVTQINPKPAVTPLGLKTTVYLMLADGSAKMVSPSTIFSGGSRIRLVFTSNKPGYLYIVNVGSSGRVTPLFPTTLADNNQIQPGLPYQIPQQPGKVIRFDNTPGREQILVVLAEAPIRSFEYRGVEVAIQSPATPSTAPQAEPARPPPQMLLASLEPAATSKDLFVEDDGPDRINVCLCKEFGPKPRFLVVPLILIHQ